MKHHTAPLSSRPARGVSLIEALVAFAVLGFGMLGVVGIQTTLRANGDHAKQRSEAVRIAQEALEDWRAFSVLNATPGHARTYVGIDSAPAADIAGYTTNTTYQLTRTVAESVPPGSKTLVVDVSWTDRSGVAQSIRMASLVSQIAPELAGGVVSPAGAAGNREPLGRHPGVPPQARDFGNGRSGFVPPQPGGGTVGWRFDNVTGLFVTCTSSVADNSLLSIESQLSACGTQNNLLVTGYLRYATRLVQPTSSDVTDANATGDGSGNYPARPNMALVQSAPTALAGTRSCFVSARGGLSYRSYFCGAAVQTGSPVWSGRVELSDRSTFEIAEDAVDDDDDRYRVCRYFSTDPYVDVQQPLYEQNYVVIRAGDDSTAFTCPTPATWLHQP
jgi:Tfp pilus assembly protein PilV